MLERAITHCPDDLWFDQSRYHQFWHVASHALFWLDYYLSGSDDDFRPPEPFGLEELDPAGVIPDRPYTKEELLTYLEYCRSKLHKVLSQLTEERAAEKCKGGRWEMTYAELLLYNMRHVQHHSAQLYMILRQQTDSAPRWQGRTEKLL